MKLLIASPNFSSDCALLHQCQHSRVNEVLHKLVQVLFHCQDLFVSHGTLSGRSICSFLSLFPSHFLWRPLILCMPCLVRLSLISFLNTPCCFISDISNVIVWTIFWLAKTSNKTISLTTRLVLPVVVNPN